MPASLHPEVSQETLALSDSYLHNFTDKEPTVEYLQRENRRLSEAVTTAVSDKEVSNIKLQKFTSKVTHDLKAPLRHINAYLSIIREDFQRENLGKEMVKNMEIISSATSNISRLIDAIRLLAKISEQEKKDEEVCLQREFGLATQRVDERYPKVDWRVSELPVVQTDLVMIRTIIHHLLDNAAKFSQTQKGPIIRISTHREKEFHVINIEDNGTGFDPRLRFKLFEIFEKLHADPNIPGSGVGLAIVDSLVEKLGGKISGNSVEGRGAVFTLKLRA